MKELSKLKGVTINDIVLCALTTALSKIFKEQGEKIDNIKIVMPANIRFKFYKSRKQIQFENKFGALPCAVKISDTMEEAYHRVSQSTKDLKNSMGLVYGIYAINFWGNKLMPRSILRH